MQRPGVDKTTKRGQPVVGRWRRGREVRSSQSRHSASICRHPVFDSIIIATIANTNMKASAHDDDAPRKNKKKGHAFNMRTNTPPPPHKKQKSTSEAKPGLSSVFNSTAHSTPPTLSSPEPRLGRSGGHCAGRWTPPWSPGRAAAGTPRGRAPVARLAEHRATALRAPQV